MAYPQYKLMLDDLQHIYVNFLQEGNVFKDNEIVFRDRLECVTKLTDLILSIDDTVDLNSNGNYDILIRHDILDIIFYIRGFRMSNTYNNGKTWLYKEILAILENIHVIYFKTNSIGIRYKSRRYIYSVLCYLAYEYLPLSYFEIDFAMYRHFTNSDLPRGVSMDMIRELQYRYDKTKNLIYVNIINLLMKERSGNYVYAVGSIARKFMYSTRKITTSEAKYIYNRCRCLKPAKAYYLDSDICKTYQLDVLKKSDYMLSEEKQKDVLIDDAYKIIGRRFYGNKIYSSIARIYKQNVLVDDIDIDKLHEVILKVDKLSPYEDSIAKTIHTASIKFCIVDNLQKTFNQV